MRNNAFMKVLYAEALQKHKTLITAKSSLFKVVLGKMWCMYSMRRGKHNLFLFSWIESHEGIIIAAPNHQYINKWIQQIKHLSSPYSKYKNNKLPLICSVATCYVFEGLQHSAFSMQQLQHLPRLTIQSERRLWVTSDDFAGIVVVLDDKLSTMIDRLFLTEYGDCNGRCSFGQIHQKSVCILIWPFLWEHLSGIWIYGGSAATKTEKRDIVF